MPRALRAATLGVLVAAATYVGADALDTVAPVTGEFVSDRTATVLAIYARAFGGAATTVVANAALLAWASAGLSVWVARCASRAARFYERRPQPVRRANPAPPAS